MTGDAWVFPIGHYLGPFHPRRDAPVDYHRVRVGRETVRLFTDDELAAWLLAHGLPGTAADRPWSRQAIEAAAREQGGDDRAAAVSGALSELIGEGAMVEVPDGTGAGIGFATAHRFCPLLVGLGADPRQPDQAIIGLTGNPVVTMDELGFQVWQWAGLYANLWAACQAFVEVGDRLSGSFVTSPGRPGSPEEMLAKVLRRVHRLLAHGAGYLDVTS
jgi:hypothetical protein